MRRRAHALAALALLLSGACDWSRPRLSPQEAGLVALLEDLRTNHALSRQEFRVLPCETDYASGPHACFSRNVRTGDMTIRQVDFRPHGRAGAIVELQGVGPGCIRLEAIQSRFAAGAIDNRCSHGTCRYYTVEARPARLSFRLPDSNTARQCISNVVVNF